ATIDELRKIRLKKLKAIEKAGFSAYPEKTRRTHKIEETLKNFSKISKTKKEVILVGRIKSQRKHGRATFLHIEDGTGKIQAFFREDRLGERGYKFFLDNFDIGDFVELRGDKIKRISDTKCVW
ncbi:unnamed protein product, partial [marine sediment metagenome]